MVDEENNEENEDILEDDFEDFEDHYEEEKEEEEVKEKKAKTKTKAAKKKKDKKKDKEEDEEIKIEKVEDEPKVKSSSGFKKYLTVFILGALIITVVFYFMGALHFGEAACPETGEEDLDCPACEDCPECPEPDCVLSSEKCRALFGIGE